LHGHPFLLIDVVLVGERPNDQFHRHEPVTVVRPPDPVFSRPRASLLRPPVIQVTCGGRGPRFQWRKLGLARHPNSAIAIQADRYSPLVRVVALERWSPSSRTPASAPPAFTRESIRKRSRHGSRRRSRPIKRTSAIRQSPDMHDSAVKNEPALQ